MESLGGVGAVLVLLLLLSWILLPVILLLMNSKAAETNRKLERLIAVVQGQEDPGPHPIFVTKDFGRFDATKMEKPGEPLTPPTKRVPFPPDA